MSKLMLTWHSQHDDRVCPICRQLDGYVWTFETGKDEFGTELVHPSFGVVWNVYVGSAAHEHFKAKMSGYPSSCRCHITAEFDLSDLLAKVQKLHDEVVAEYGQG
jgi:hypothetical protein